MSVTLGVKECLSARKVRLFSDTGAWKQTALRVALFGPITAEYPITLLQEHPDALITATVDTATASHRRAPGVGPGAGSREIRQGADATRPRFRREDRIGYRVAACRYRAMIGTGGIGSGMFFALDGDHTLGREESRSGRFLDRRDYCKLHIIAHYVKALLGPAFPGDPARQSGRRRYGRNAAGRDGGSRARFALCGPRAR